MINSKKKKQHQAIPYKTIELGVLANVAGIFSGEFLLHVSIAQSKIVFFLFCRQSND
jgi:hypothetical protein